MKDTKPFQPLRQPPSRFPLSRLHRSTGLRARAENSIDIHLYFQPLPRAVLAARRGMGPRRQ